MTDSVDAFFEAVGDPAEGRFRASRSTGGPWDPRHQHGGPPSALLAYAIEGCEPREDVMVARVTSEILGPVPVGEVTVRARVSRRGRSVELVEGELVADGRVAVRAAAWRIRTAPGDLPDAVDGPVPPPLPEVAAELRIEGWYDGYLSAVEWRPVAGGFGESGPATVWTRLRAPLVAGQPTSPLQRLLVVADAGNGLSASLDMRSWWFINPELTVHLLRPAVGDWVCVDARTTISAGGVGLAETDLYDGGGRVGRGAQSLLVVPR